MGEPDAERVRAVLAGDRSAFGDLYDRHARWVRALGYEATRKKYAKDLQGKLHDVILMSNDLSKVWRSLARQIEELDTQPSRTIEGQY